MVPWGRIPGTSLAIGKFSLVAKPPFVQAVHARKKQGSDFFFFQLTLDVFLSSKNSTRLALSCSSVTACSRLMPLLVGPGFHAQVHLVGQYSNFKCLSFSLLPSSIIPFHPTICVIFFCLKSLYCCSLLHSMTNYPSSHIFSAQKCTVTQSHGIITCCALYFLTVHSSVSLYFPASFCHHED